MLDKATDFTHRPQAGICCYQDEEILLPPMALDAPFARKRYPMN